MQVGVLTGNCSDVSSVVVADSSAFSLGVKVGDNNKLSISASIAFPLDSWSHISHSI